MPKKPRIEDAETQALMEAGTQSVEWVREEFAQADLADKRLNRRLA
ncbi:MAG: transposase DNA-binding-containing protein [Acidiferrobacter sp.]